GVVPRSLPTCDVSRVRQAAIRRARGDRRGWSGLPLPPACAHACPQLRPGDEAHRASAGPRRTRPVSLSPLTKAWRRDAFFFRRRAIGRRETRWRARPHARRSDLHRLQLAQLLVSRARAIPRAVGTLVGSVSERAVLDSQKRGPLRKPGVGDPAGMGVSRCAGAGQEDDVRLFDRQRADVRRGGRGDTRIPHRLLSCAERGTLSVPRSGLRLGPAPTEAPCEVRGMTLRRHARSCAAVALRASLIPLCLRHTVQRGRVTILVYHDPKPDAFRRQLSVLVRLYSVVSLRDAVDALEAGSVRRLPKRPLVITFDDGHLGNYGLLPMLREYGVPATVFVCTGIVGTSDDFWFDAVDDSERYKRIPDAARLARLEHETGASVEVGERKRAALSWTELREMSSLVDAQSHTIS